MAYIIAILFPYQWSNTVLLSLFQQKFQSKFLQIRIEFFFKTQTALYLDNLNYFAFFPSLFHSITVMNNIHYILKMIG